MITNEKYKRLIKGGHKWKIQTANKRLSQMKNTNCNKKVVTNEKYRRVIKGYHKWKIQTANKRWTQM